MRYFLFSKAPHRTMQDEKSTGKTKYHKSVLAEKSSSIKSIECDLKSCQLDVRQVNGFVKRSLSQLLQTSF